MAKEYIEREALKEDLKESYERLRAIYDSLTYNEDKQICAGQLTTFTEAILRVKEAPAADVVKVRHGKWVHSEIEDDDWGRIFHEWTCSVCGYSVAHNPTGENYCPNCGAYMMGENNGKCE